MQHDTILTRRNWCEVAADLGLMLPNFTLGEHQGRFIDWCYVVELIDDLQCRALVGTFVEQERARANALALAPVMEDA